MITIELDEDSDGATFVSWRSSDTRLFEAARSAFRRFLPTYLVSYNGGLRSWRIEDEGRDDLRVFLDYMERTYNARIEGWDDANELERAAAPVEEAFRTLYLLPDAPLEVVKASYKALALIHHPDRGGDVVQMQRINTAHSTILQARTDVRAA